MELIVDEARSFNLVPGFTYRILCRSSVGFGGLLNVWQDDGGNGITIMTPAPELNFDQTAVYSTQLDAGDANEWSLVLQSFSGSSTGTYVCQTEEGTTNATLVIGEGECSVLRWIQRNIVNRRGRLNYLQRTKISVKENKLGGGNIFF